MLSVISEIKDIFENIQKQQQLSLA